jgi:hypothetical protein
MLNSFQRDARALNCAGGDASSPAAPGTSPSDDAAPPANDGSAPSTSRRPTRTPTRRPSSNNGNENDNSDDNDNAAESTATRTPTATREPTLTKTPTPTKTPRPDPTDTPTPIPLGAPSISGFDQGSAICGQTLTIRGDQFGSSRSIVDGHVSVAGVDAQVNSWDMTRIDVTVPRTAQPGNDRQVDVFVGRNSAHKSGVRVSC